MPSHSRRRSCHRRTEGDERQPEESHAVPFLAGDVRERWRAWHAAPLGGSGATIVEAEMADWSGAVPSSLEAVVHVLVPGSPPIHAIRDLGDGRSGTLARAGQVCVTPAGCPGHYAWEGHWRDLNLVLPEDFLAHVADDAGLPVFPDLMTLARAPSEDTLIEGLVLRLGAVGRGEVRSFTAEIEHAIALVACWLLRQAGPDSISSGGGLSARAVRRVRAYVEANLDRDLAVGELARLVGLSIPYFSHAFRNSMGEAPYRYILRRRCSRACELLLGPDKLNDIALAVGFSTQPHFTTTFRRVIGTTPAAWRRARSD